jgi:hypothetical protein
MLLIMIVYLFPLVVFIVVSKGQLPDHSAQWSLDIYATVKHCVHLSRLVHSGVHLSGLVRSPMNLNISPMNMKVLITDMNLSSRINM